MKKALKIILTSSALAAILASSAFAQSNITKEKVRLQQYANIAQRNGDQLCIKISKGEPACFTDGTPESNAFLKYTFIGVAPKVPVAIV